MTPNKILITQPDFRSCWIPSHASMKFLAEAARTAQRGTGARPGEAEEAWDAESGARSCPAC